MKTRFLKNKSPDLLEENKKRLDEIHALNEKLTLANEELKITNEELKSYQNKLESLVSIRTQELQKKEASINYKNNLERLFTGISTKFFNLAPDHVDDCITISLKEISEFFNTDSSFLGEIKYSENCYCLTHIWKNELVSYDEEYFKNAPLSDLSWWLDKTNVEEAFTVDYTKSNPRHSLKNNLQIRGIAKVKFVPILYQYNIVGFIGIVCNEKSLEWGRDEISFMHQVAEVFVNALSRKESVRILIENERNYREIFNATSEAILIYDYNNKQLIDVNQAALKLFGANTQDISSAGIDDFSNIASGFTSIVLAQHVDKAISGGHVVFEWHAKRKNGDLFWLEISLKHTEIAGDLRILAVLRDISERKISQEIIMQSEERFRSIVQFLTDIIIIIDRDINILYESPSCSSALGYPAGYLIGKNGLDIIHPEDIPLALNDLKQVFAKKNKHVPTEFRAKNSSGHWLTLEVIADNMLDHPGIQGIIITGRDVTERRRVEKALKISETKFRNIFNNTSDPVVIINNKYLFLEVNEVFFKATGYTSDVTQKMKLTEIITDPYLPSLVEKLGNIFKKENQPVLECEIKRNDKSTFPAEINSKLIEFEGEVALISVIRDITDRKQLENRILDTIISTEEKEREKFARNLHDELGPLLSSIKMYVNSLSSSVEKAKHDFIISQLKTILHEVIQSTKELSNDLSPHVLTNYGLIAALEWFINQFKPYIIINFETNIKIERFPNSMELSVYRIVKELINNTVKHAQATQINIKLFMILKSIHLHYEDNGKGFDGNWRNKYEFMGMGMSNIISRCRSINATNKFFNNAPNGMAFEMQVPTGDYLF